MLGFLPRVGRISREEAAALAGSSIEAVLSKVETFMNGAPPNDDCTMLEVLYSR